MTANKRLQFGNHLGPQGPHQALGPGDQKRAGAQRDLDRGDLRCHRPPLPPAPVRLLQLPGTRGRGRARLHQHPDVERDLRGRHARDPTQIIALAEQWLKPGTIILGHLNHTPILSLLDQIQSIITARNLDPVTMDEMFGTSRPVG